MKKLVPSAAFATLLVVSALLVPPYTAGAATTEPLNVARSGTGGGAVTSDVPGIDCGTTCSYDFASGTVVTLTATPHANSTFVGWTGDCSGAGTCQVTTDAPHAVGARFDLSYRPDASIKLCGLSTGCTIDPLPHPWRGNDIYNGTGRRQTVGASLDNGEGVRFWIAVQNDGAFGDDIVVQGCSGNRVFVVNRVVLGKEKRPDASATDVKRAFLRGTLDFSLPASTKRSFFTVNFLTPTPTVGVSYRCHITISSTSDTTLHDTVVARMSTY